MPAYDLLALLSDQKPEFIQIHSGQGLIHPGGLLLSMSGFRRWLFTRAVIRLFALDSASPYGPRSNPRHAQRGRFGCP